LEAENLNTTIITSKLPVETTAHIKHIFKSKITKVVSLYGTQTQHKQAWPWWRLILCLTIRASMHLMRERVSQLATGALGDGEPCTPYPPPGTV